MPETPPSRETSPSAGQNWASPEFVEKARRALQNELITHEEHLLALNTGVLTVDPGPGQPELVLKLMTRLAKTKTDKKAYEAVIDELLKLNNGLTHIAVHIKTMGQMEGATVEVAVAQGASGKFLIAGLNSSARQGWTPKQLKELKRLGIEIAPLRKGLAKQNPTQKRTSFGVLMS